MSVQFENGEHPVGVVELRPGSKLSEAGDFPWFTAARWDKLNSEWQFDYPVPDGEMKKLDVKSVRVSLQLCLFSMERNSKAKPTKAAKGYRLSPNTPSPQRRWEQPPLTTIEEVGVQP